MITRKSICLPFSTAAGMKNDVDAILAKHAMNLTVACLCPVCMRPTHNALMVSVVLDDPKNIVRFANRPCI